VIQQRLFAPGDIIIHEYEYGETAFVIEQGRVEVSRMVDGRRVHIAYLGDGRTFGEMSLIEEKPRSATVTEVEKTVVREIHRDELFTHLKEDSEGCVRLLRELLERLREADNKILQLQRDSGAPSPSQVAPASAAVSVRLRGDTSVAVHSLPESPLEIPGFPYRIGRHSSDPLAHNDLAVVDEEPYQVSRHHLALICEGCRIGVVDRGSHLGTIVDGRKLGGPDGDPGPLFFEGPEGALILGSDQSRFQFTVLVERG